MLEERNAFIPYPSKDLLQFLAKIPHEEEIVDRGALPKDLLKGLRPFKKITFRKGQKLEKKPLKVGIVLSGGPAPGGHNVIAGVFDAITTIDEKSILLGFLSGPKGLIDNQFKVLTSEEIDPIRNTGGFNIIGTGRTKIESEEQFQLVEKTVLINGLDALVIVGGDDSNTNAAHLANFFIEKGIETSVIGVPKTIDGDLKNEWIEASFGFDTASKTYSELIGNVMQDALSQKKYTFFVKVMGREASHLVLECALATSPNIALIGEEIYAEKWTLKKVVDFLADAVMRRSLVKKEYGVFLIPEGLVEFIPEFKMLIRDLSKGGIDTLEGDSKELFCSLPTAIQEQLLLDRDPHGNIQVSKIETERLLIDLVKNALQKNSSFKGVFNALPLFFGYEGRSAFPSDFDCNYAYSLGVTSVLLLLHKKTGVMAALKGLALPPREWEPFGVSLGAMLGLEERKGKSRAVIKKAHVDLKGAPFQAFLKVRNKALLEDLYTPHGPIQFFGPPSIKESVTATLRLSFGSIILS